MIFIFFLIFVLLCVLRLESRRLKRDSGVWRVCVRRTPFARLPRPVGWRGAAWRGVAWRGVAWRGEAVLRVGRPL